MLRGFLLALLLAATPRLAAGDTIRIATYDLGMGGDGPGLLAHELETGPEPQSLAAVAVIRAVRPDVLLLNGFDHDLRGRALDALRVLLRSGPDGIDYPHVFAAPVNAGVPSGFDLDGDGRSMGRGDGLGWGRFPGNGGMAILSRLPLDKDGARTFASLAWSDLPGAELPQWPGGGPFPDADAQAALRLSSRSHWDLPVILPGGGRLHLLASNPTPPLFDGPERFNVHRNGDEVRFWSAYLGGTPFTDDRGTNAAAADAPVVVLGNLNLDPLDGAGEQAAIGGLIAHARLRDPRPASAGGAAARDGANAGHDGPPALDTADFRDDAGGPGNLRLDYVLLDARLAVDGSGVFWPSAGPAARGGSGSCVRPSPRVGRRRAPEVALPLGLSGFGRRVQAAARCEGRGQPSELAPAWLFRPCTTSMSGASSAFMPTTW